MRTTESTPASLWWYDLVQPYVKNQQILACPSQPKSLNNGTLGYGINCCMLCPHWCAPSSRPYLGEIPRPADILFIADSAFWLACSWEVAWANVCEVSCTPSVRIDSNTRHVGGSNTLFCDGHAKWFNAQTIGNQAWMDAHIINYKQ